MIHRYSRRLDNLDLIEHFLKVVLNYQEIDKTLLNKIKSGEAELKNYDNSSATLNNTSHRDRDYVDNTERWKLRKQIVDELIELKRDNDDEKINLGNGGALPLTNLKNENKAVIIIGLPASGKSGVAARIADDIGAIILDSDFAKRKLPEFRDNPAGASLVHDESDILVFGYSGNDKPDDFLSLVEICKDKGYNIVIPKIGHDHISLNKLAEGLKNLKYETHLVLVSLDRRKATTRAVQRFKDTDRYVPLSLIFDGYGNDPILSFYRLKDKVGIDDLYIDTFGKISTDVQKDENPRVIYCEDKNPVCIFKK